MLNCDGPRSGGLNAADPGSTLLRHIDFNYSSMLGMYRSINVIIYLNKKDWSIDDGGNWNCGMLSLFYREKPLPVQRVSHFRDKL